jgi:hypothetical protein
MVREGLIKPLNDLMKLLMEVMEEQASKTMVAEKKMVVLLVIEEAASLRCSLGGDSGRII